MAANVLKFTAYSRKNSLIYLLIVIPILIFYSLLFHFLKNIPYIDDFYWYFNFIDQFDQVPTFFEKLNVFLKPYNDHRHYFQRILILPCVYLFRGLNISFFVILGNITFLLFVYNFFQPTIKNIAGLVVSTWLFFQPSSFMNYYTFAFFNLPVLLFSLLCIRSMIQQANLTGLILLGILATFSNGNGLLVWVLGMLISFNQANYKRLFVFSFILITLVILFYLQNTFNIENTQVGANRPINVEFFTDTVLYFIQIYASFIDWSFYKLSWIALPVGLIILFIFAKILVDNKFVYRRSAQSHSLYYLLFLSLSMLLISVKRASVDGLTANVIDHYRLYPCIFLGCIVYYYMTNENLTKSLQRSLVVIGIVITLLNYTTYLPRMYAHFTHQLADALNYSVTGKWLFYPPIQSKKEYDFVNAVSNSVVNKKFYAPFKPRESQKSTGFKTQIDSSQTALTLRINDAGYLPLIENAFFVIKCQGLTYHFPVMVDRSWKDLLKLRLRQPTVATIIEWGAMHEPCLGQPSTIQYAVLRGSSLTYYPLAVGVENAAN